MEAWLSLSTGGSPTRSTPGHVMSAPEGTMTTLARAGAEVAAWLERPVIPRPGAC